MKKSDTIGIILERIDMIEKGLYTDAEAKDLLRDNIELIEKIPFREKEFNLLFKAQCNFLMGRIETDIDKKRGILRLAREQAETVMNNTEDSRDEDLQSLCGMALSLAAGILLELQDL